MSPNGMVRPCARPASNKSWEGTSRQGARHIPDTERCNCRVGIDIGKNSFHIVGHDERGAIVSRQKWSRGQVEARFANMPPCLVGMETCVGAHHLSRKLRALGHDARLPTKYVRLYSKGQKNDFRDAEAIAEAVQRPTMKFVATKTADDARPLNASSTNARPDHTSRHLRPFLLRLWRLVSRSTLNCSVNCQVLASKAVLFFLAAPYFDKQRLVTVNTVAKKFAIICCVTGLLGTSVASPASAAQPDFSGVWIPDVRDQKRQEMANMPPWKPDILPQIQHMISEEKAGRPFLVLSHCLPHGMPSWMLMTHNAFELLITPGRITMLGEVDGNRMRRIYMDGRPHPEDPDLTLHGHSIGHWDGEALVIDTTAIAPQAYIAISEAAGIPNNGDMHILERLYLAKPDVLYDDLEITAPKVLDKTWKTTRIFRRYPERHYEITEGECVEEDLVPGKDKSGNDIFIPNPQSPDGSVRTVK